MENATFRKWLTEHGCRFDTQRSPSCAVDYHSPMTFSALFAVRR